MGQDFEVVSPSAYEKLGFGVKLGEMLFDTSPELLVLRFAVPVRHSASAPGSTSSALYRSDSSPSQNLEAKESDDKEPGGLQYAKRNREEHNPDSHPTEPRQKIQKLCGSDASEAQNRLTFSNLPVEVHDLIFEELDIESIILLSLTSHCLFSHGRRHIRNFFLSHLAPWAGESIICVGEYVEVGDYPPSVLQDEELRQALNLDEDGEQISLYDFLDRCEEVRPRVDFPEVFGHMFKSKGFRREYFRMPKPLMSLLDDTIRPGLSQFYPKEQPWILRNLTTREYVRADAIALKPEYINGPEIRHLGFGEVIMSRVCWSTSPSVSMTYVDQAPIHRGVWAGHRFDITTVARHEQEIKQGEQKHEDGNELDTEKAADWKDISDEVAKEIACIWESEYGTSWREITCR